MGIISHFEDWHSNNSYKNSVPASKQTNTVMQNADFASMTASDATGLQMATPRREGQTATKTRLE